MREGRRRTPFTWGQSLIFPAKGSQLDGDVKELCLGVAAGLSGHCWPRWTMTVWFSFLCSKRQAHFWTEKQNLREAGGRLTAAQWWDHIASPEGVSLLVMAKCTFATLNGYALHRSSKETVFRGPQQLGMLNSGQWIKAGFICLLHGLSGFTIVTQWTSETGGYCCLLRLAVALRDSLSQLPFHFRTFSLEMLGILGVPGIRLPPKK